MPQYKDKAIILKKINFAESSEILYLLSERHGRISAIFKKSSLSGYGYSSAPEPFMEISALFCTGRNLDVLQQFFVVNTFAALRNDLRSLSFGIAMLEIFEKLVPAMAVEEKNFPLLKRYLERLSSGEEPFLLTFYAISAFLKHFGVAPVFNHCAICGRNTFLDFFDVSLGGMVCSFCAPAGAIYDSSLVSFMKKSGELPFEKMREYGFDPSIPPSLITVMDEYILYHTGYRVNSFEFLKKLY